MGELRQIKRQAAELLGELGESPDEVAASLESAGVRGVPKSNTSCAIALYTAALMRTDPRVRGVAVGPCSLLITLTRPADSRPAGKLSVQLPKPVRDFVAGFDARRYPTVVRDQPAAPSDPVSAAAPVTGG